MRWIVPLMVTGMALSTPAWATLNVFYQGTTDFGDKPVPATAQFSVEKGRAAFVMHGESDSRMLFLEDQGLFRIVNDTDKMVYDMKCGEPGANPMLEQMKKQLEQLPPEQRKMAEQMMEKQMGSAAKQAPAQYVWSEETKTIGGYECTRVDDIQGGVKKSEYWASKSDDFKMSDDERATIVAMQGCIGNGPIAVTGSVEGGARAFSWDTTKDGYPVVTRCFRGDKTTLDLTLQKFNRDKIDEKLFDVPKDYRAAPSMQ